MARKYQLHGAFPSKAGDSAYQVALKNGFEGTEQEWLASLVGEPGPEGPAGKDGLQDAVLYTPQELTEEQQAQVWENIGLNNLPSGDEAVGRTKVIDIELTEAVNSVSYTLTAEDVEKLDNARFVFIDIVAHGLTGETPAKAAGAYDISFKTTDPNKYHTFISNWTGIPGSDWSSTISNHFTIIKVPNVGKHMILLSNRHISNSDNYAEAKIYQMQWPSTFHITTDGSFVVESSQLMGAGTTISVSV